MNSKTLVASLRRDLHQAAESKYQKAQQWFFKEGIALLGVRVGKVRTIGNKHYAKLESKEKDDVLRIAEELMKIELQEMRIVGTQWARKQQKHFATNDFPRFERWVKRYVSNWAICDGVSVWLVGDLLRQYPSLIPRTAPWRSSRNRWVRRAAAVSLIPLSDQKKALPIIFQCTDSLLLDEDDMVQKGYGWLLKEASNDYPTEVFNYVMKRKTDMPRTALRYAIEKLSATRRTQAMAK